MRPPDFDPSRRYPVVLLVHGGPQGAWVANFHYRSNYNLFAAPGYVVVAINPRGSTGYGQRFTDEISRDWSGRVFTDLMNGLDAALARFPFLDDSNMAAAGGSYGGYMMNWFQGHTDRFRTLINPPVCSICARCTSRPRSCGSRNGSSAGRRGRVHPTTKGGTRRRTWIPGTLPCW